MTTSIKTTRSTVFTNAWKLVKQAGYTLSNALKEAWSKVKNFKRMRITEIKNKALWSEGFITGNNKKPFFRIDSLSKEDSEAYHNGKPFMIFLQGANFNKQMYQLITEKKFGEYSSKILTDSNGFLWNNPEGYKMCLDENGFINEILVPSMYKSYLYSISNIDYVLDKIIEVEAIVGKNVVPALEVIL